MPTPLGAWFVVLAVIATPPLRARATDDCRVRKSALVIRDAAHRLRCHAGAQQRGSGVPSAACLAARATQRGTRFARVEGDPTCQGAATDAAIAPWLDRFEQVIVQGMLADPARTAYGRILRRAFAMPACPFAGSEPQGFVSIVQSAVAPLTTTLAALCGDDTKAFDEMCDGADSAACPTLCDAACTCPHPVYGNAIRESGEDCDPPLPGLCSATCRLVATCGFDFCSAVLPCCVGQCTFGLPGAPPGVGACL